MRLEAVFNALFAEQVEFFRQKLALPTDRWDDILRQAHDRAFIVAGAAKADLLDDLQQAVFSRMTDGKGLEAFRRDFRRIVAQRGWTGWTGEGSKAGEAWRTKVIYQTNMTTSYAAGRYKQMTDPEFLRVRPYWRYVHSDGVLHPRPLHQQWGAMRLTLPADHEFWKTHFPPNGWGCQCRVVPVAAPEGEDATEPPEGWATRNAKTGAPEGIDRGFDYAPGANRDASLRELVERKLIGYPPAIAKALEAELASVLPGIGAAPSTVVAPWHATTGTTEGAWHDASFSESPQWLKDAVGKRGALGGGVVQGKGSAHYSASKDQINMQALQSSSLRAQGTWRHEYGHAMDAKLGKGMRFRSTEADFVAAMRQDADDLIRLGGHGHKGHKATKEAIARLQTAYDNTAEAVRQAADPVQWLTQRYAASGMDFKQVQAAMQRHTVFANDLQGVGLNRRYARIITAIEERDAQGLMDALTGGRKTKESFDAYNKGSTGNLSDLFGSATSNKVSGISKSGFGHPDSYYKHPFAGEKNVLPIWPVFMAMQTPSGGRSSKP